MLGPSVGVWNDFAKALFPSFEAFEEGSLSPLNKMYRYLKQGAAGEVRTLLGTAV
jgi:hypothetical protein